MCSLRESRIYIALWLVCTQSVVDMFSWYTTVYGPDRNMFFASTTPAKVVLAVKSTLLRLPAIASKPKTD